MALPGTPACAGPDACTRQAGLTLVELVISILIINIAAAGVLLVYSTVLRSSANPLIDRQARAVAEAYLDEILQHPIDDPDGVDGEGNRSAFDDVDDYDGLNEAPTDQTGTTIAGLAAYAVQVTVADTTAIGPAGQQPVAGRSMRVDVQVDHAAGLGVLLSGYRVQP